MRTMYDSITPNRIPADAPIVASYVDGMWPNYPQLKGTHPNAIHVSIAVFPQDDAMVLDIESGDATPAQAPAWVVRQRARGIEPTVYCNVSTYPAVRQAFMDAKVALPPWWAAKYTGQPFMQSGSVATQYQDNSPMGWDASLVADYWATIDGPILPPKPAKDRLVAGQILLPNHPPLMSVDGQYELTLQGDGNLVIYQHLHAAKWSTRTNGTPANRLVMQGDGNLVLYGPTGKVYWATMTQHKGGNRVVMQSDGNLVIYDGINRAVWSRF